MVEEKICLTAVGGSKIGSLSPYRKKPLVNKLSNLAAF